VTTQRFEGRFEYVPGDTAPDTHLLRGVDTTTGEPVAIAPRSSAWEHDVVTEAIARRVATVRSQLLARVVHAGPGVVFAAPPPAAPRRDLRDRSTEAAAELTVQACEVAAALHAAGVARLPFSDRNPRIALAQGEPFVHWIVPARDMGRPLFVLPGSQGRFLTEQQVEMAALLADPVRHDLWGLVHFFFVLHPAPDERAPGALGALVAMLRAPSCLPSDVRSLAHLVALTSAASGELVARADAIPAIRSVPPLGIDWDAVIAEGEALLARHEEETRPKRSGTAIVRPFKDGRLQTMLADAYHQRACGAFQDGDRAAALRDAQRAVALEGEWLPYQTTCAVILDGLGRTREARRLLGGGHPRGEPERSRTPEDARFYATRGLVCLRLRRFKEAVRDLDLAFDVAPTAFHAHALGAARYALGDIAGAAEVEARSVELEPANARYRWALVISLHKLGRDAEARTHAEEILAREPKNTAHRDRFARLFGG
jgi:Flp pilus assembly protein TadD